MASKASGPQGMSKKRNRVPLSCESCRSRKLKCDRQKPCQNCNARGMQASCTFATSVSSNGRSRATNHAPASDEMRARLQRLESLIGSMAQTDVPKPTMPTPESSADDRADESDILNIAPDLDTKSASLVGQQFIASSNWEAVLHDLAVIREHFEDGNEPPQNDSISDSKNPALLSGISCDITRSELIDGLPSKSLADRLLYRLFDTYDPAVPSRQILHKPTFVKEYARFWSNVAQSSLTSVGRMYSVFCLALQSYDRQDDEPPDLRGVTIELSETYRKRAAQCLIKADIVRPDRDTLELMVLSGMSEYARNNDSTAAEWFCLGIAIRKAFHMGYHRDPDVFPSLTPFEREMRRRLWAHIWQIDTLFSFSLGLPSAVTKTNSNVKAPLNLFEEELYEGMSELPAPHPGNVATPISYTIAKLNVIRGLADVVDHMGSMEEHTCPEVHKLNDQLSDALGKIPDFLHIKSWDESIGEPKSLRLQRLQLRLFYDKASCMLNRRFLNLTIKQYRGRYQTHPRDLCLQSALSLLSIQNSFHREGSKWYKFALSRHDFLLAAVILFLVLGKKLNDQPQSMAATGTIALDEENIAIIRALQKSREIWGEQFLVSPHARSACRMFDKMSERYNFPSYEAVASLSIAPVRPTPAPNQIDMALLDSGTKDIDLSMPPLPAGDDSDPVYDVMPPGFDWSAWENSFEAAGMETGFDDMEAFWPPDGINMGIL